jgi:hypothetical protein
MLIDEHSLIDQASLSTILGITINQIQALVRDRVFREVSAGHFQLVQTIQAWSAYLSKCNTSNGGFRKNITLENKQSYLGCSGSADSQLIIHPKAIPWGDFGNKSREETGLSINQYLESAYSDSDVIGQWMKTNNTHFLPHLVPNKVDNQHIDKNRGYPADLYTPLGIIEFDRKYGGVVCDAINILEAADQNSSIAALGHYISSGLEQGKRVAFVSFENPKHALAKLEQYGFGSLESYLKKEQLIYIYYTPLFTKALSLSFDYRRLFEEIDQIGGQEITRVAFANCEVLFNLQSVPLAKASAIKLLSATENKKFTTLGSYIRREDSGQKNLTQACESTLISYITIDKCGDNGTSLYQFAVRKSLNMATEDTLKLKLLKQYGFVKEDAAVCEIPKKYISDIKHNIFHNMYQHWSDNRSTH